MTSQGSPALPTVRIAAGQGFWGDWLEAPYRQVTGGPIDYLILADFAYAHTDITAADGYLAKALAGGESGPKISGTTRCLALMAAGHLHFKHFPRTDIEAA